MTGELRMVKDLLGNDLAKGDLVEIHHLVGPTIIAKIVQISEGGVAIPPQSLPMNVPKGAIVLAGGNLKVLVEVNITFDPTKPINILKIFDPNKDLSSAGAA